MTERDNISLKIVILGSIAKSLINFRGDLIKEFIRKGYTVYACAPDKDDDIVNTLRKWGVEFKEVPLKRTGMNPIADIYFLLYFTKYLIKLKPDILLTYTSKAVIFGSFAGYISRVTNLYSIITGLGYYFIGNNIKQKIIYTVIKYLYRFSLKNNTHIFFQNHDDRDLFINTKIINEKTKISVINGSGVNIQHYYYSDRITDPPVYLMIARLLVDKGVREYYHAAKIVKEKYPEVTFQLMGRYDTNPASIRKEQIQKWQDEGIIQYLGVQSDVRPFLKNASVYVLPSYREGTPRTVLEAMSMGLPIITTDVPGCRETVKDGYNGYLVPHRDSPSIAGAMIRFIQNPELINTMGRRSREMAIFKYDVKNVNQSIFDIIERNN